MTVKEIMEQAKDGSISWEDIKKREGLDTEMEKLEKMVRKLEDDTIGRQDTITEIKNYERDSTAPIDYVHIVEQMPPVQLSRIERELHGKTPEEQYEILYQLMFEYANTFNDARRAVIDWLGE